MNKVRQIFSMRSSREWLLALIDAACVGVAFFIATLLCRFHEISAKIILETLICMPILMVLTFIFCLTMGVYRCIWRYASLRDYVKIAVAVFISSVTFAVLDFVVFTIVSNIATYIVSFLLVLTILTFIRIIYAYFYAQLRDKAYNDETKRTMIIGAGYTAKSVLEELVRKKSFYKPCCIIDDDVSKIGRSLYGVPVVGNTNEIVKYAKRYTVETIIFAIPSMSEGSRKTILNDCLGANCELKVLPFMDEMINKVDLVSQIKDLNIEDLLGRAPIRFDEADIKAYISGASVMITGGGGSIGSELVRQVAKHGAQRVVIVEIYENCAYNIQQEIWRNYGKDFPLSVEIASVTDYDKMDELFIEYKPDIIFHAAAHKHVPLMETNPEEAVKNNVYGTYNMVELAHKHKLRKFIMISTDKAVNPTNVMGATKRLCEMIVQSKAQVSTYTEFASVRFGNVLGSNGSVIPLFKEQINKGGPVTVTHKEIIRYFMTIPEAVSLVLQAGGYAKGGEIFVLDMGSPVKIVTLAENLIRMMGYKPYEDIDIQFSGLRPGEKLYEELLMGEEGLSKTANEKIYIGHQSPIDSQILNNGLDELKIIAYSNDKPSIVDKMKELVPTFSNNTLNKSLSEILSQDDLLEDALTEVDSVAEESNGN